MNSKGLSMINTESTCCAQVAMKANLPVLLASAVILLLTSVATAQPAEKKPVYQDPTLSIRVRVDDLMSRMTLKEIVGQLNMPCLYVEQLGKDIPAKLEGCRRFAEGTHTDEI